MADWPLNVLVVYVPHLITCFKFGDDRFRGLASAEGQILPFPIDFDGRPYNTLTLPCERVIPYLLTYWQYVGRDAFVDSSNCERGILRGEQGTSGDTSGRPYCQRGDIRPTGVWRLEAPVAYNCCSGSKGQPHALRLHRRYEVRQFVHFSCSWNSRPST